MLSFKLTLLTTETKTNYSAVGDREEKSSCVVSSVNRGKKFAPKDKVNDQIHVVFRENGNSRTISKQTSGMYRINR